MRPYRFHPDARAEFHQSARYYELQEPGLGRRFVEAVRTATRRVNDRPCTGKLNSRFGSVGS